MSDPFPTPLALMAASIAAGIVANPCIACEDSSETVDLIAELSVRIARAIVNECADPSSVVVVMSAVEADKAGE